MIASISGSVLMHDFVNIYSNVLYIIKQPLAEKVWDIWPLHAVVRFWTYRSLWVVI